jgi:hypothetical protein
LVSSGPDSACSSKDSKLPVGPLGNRFGRPLRHENAAMTIEDHNSKAEHQKLNLHSFPKYQCMRDRRIKMGIQSTANAVLVVYHSSKGGRINSRDAASSIVSVCESDDVANSSSCQGDKRSAPFCFVIDMHHCQVTVCGVCGSSTYCSKEFQKQDWDLHKLLCTDKSSSMPCDLVCILV